MLKDDRRNLSKTRSRAREKQANHQHPSEHGNSHRGLLISSKITHDND